MTKMIEREREERGERREEREGERRRKKEKEGEREKKRWVSLSETVRYPPLKNVICV
ncbi:MAG: hypothetical protein MR984_09340 [Bacteroidales bacterium]|nr:hypothetical protein [Bacteroidales bacterium]